MFKLIVLFCLAAMAFGKPSGLEEIHVAHEVPVLKTALISEPAHLAVHEPVLTRVGEHIESIPTSVSHQSSTIVHSKANLITPLIAPAVKTHLAPAVRTYAAQYLDTQPIVKTYAASPLLKSYVAAPAAYTYSSASSPLVLHPGASAPLVYSYGYGLPYYRSW